jgi:hypothetical protein
LLPGESGARDRRPYTITDAGRAAFLAWLKEQPSDDIIRVPLLLKLSFADHLDEETLASFAATHRARHAARLAGYRQLETAGDQTSPAAHVLRYGILHEEAVLAWFDTLPWGFGKSRTI